MTDHLARARADLDRGRLWKARDRLTGMLKYRADGEVVDLLGTVYFEMKDLPAAGSLWFVTGREDDRAQLAATAWRERFGSDEARWQSLPARVREGDLDARLRDLEAGAERTMEARWAAHRSDGTVLRSTTRADRFEVAVAITLRLGLIAMTVLAAVGLWTVLHWIWT